MQNSKYEVIEGIVRRSYSAHRRSRPEIMLDILRNCFAEPTTITEVMHKANTSWKEVNDFSVILMRKGLMMQTIFQGKRLFHTTPEGKKIVFMWNTLRGILEL